MSMYEKESLAAEARLVAEKKGLLEQRGNPIRFMSGAGT
jgi:hypothetical protein